MGAAKAAAMGGGWQGCPQLRAATIRHFLRQNGAIRCPLPTHTHTFLLLPQPHPSKPLRVSEGCYQWHSSELQVNGPQRAGWPRPCTQSNPQPPPPLTPSWPKASQVPLPESPHTGNPPCLLPRGKRYNTWVLPSGSCHFVRHTHAGFGMLRNKP